MASAGIPVLDMAANTADLGKIISAAIGPKIAEYGITLPEFYIENISLPEEVEKAMDKRTSMGIVGDLNKYMQFNAAEGMAQPGSGIGAMMGAGMAAGMGAGMAQNLGPWGAAPAAPPAPPPPPAPPAPPSAKLWHVAVNGETTGPFDVATLAAMAAKGQLTATSHVWSAGQDGWKTVADSALAGLLGAAPPPPPGA